MVSKMSEGVITSSIAGRAIVHRTELRSARLQMDEVRNAAFFMRTPGILNLRMLL